MICDSDLSLFGRMANSRVHKDEKVQRAELSLLWCLRLKYLPTEYSKSNLRFMLQVLGKTRLNDNFKSTLCCICLGRCCLGLETRVIIKILKNPW